MTSPAPDSQISPSTESQPQPQFSPVTTASQLPPEALSLAHRLFDAARHGEFSLLDAALAHNAGIANLTNDNGDTLVMLAAYHGHVELVRLLLRHGADPNRLNDRGQSPLAGVVFKGERGCVDALLAAGADPRVGRPSALEACKVFGMDELEGLFREQVQKLDEGRKGDGEG